MQLIVLIALPLPTSTLTTLANKNLTLDQTTSQLQQQAQYMVLQQDMQIITHYLIISTH